jgi:hypothetical protein
MKTIQDAVSTNSSIENHTVTTNTTEEEQSQFRPDAAETAEIDRRDKWAKRADVVYHFFSYRYFDRSNTCLDLLNFSDADIDSFNLTANKTRGLDNWHVCAEYLQKLDIPTPETNTHRRRFIYHVHSFNKTQPSHFRFYLQNLTADDVEYVKGLCKQEKTIPIGEVKNETMLIWATPCIEDKTRYEVHAEEIDGAGMVNHVEVRFPDSIQLLLSQTL